MYKDEKSRLYEQSVSAIARQAMKGRAPLEGPVVLVVDAHLPIPKSASKKRQAAMRAGIIRPTKKPDSTNIAKAVEDGMNGIVFKDDSQIVDSHHRKIYSDTPCVVVRVEPIITEKDDAEA